MTKKKKTLELRRQNTAYSEAVRSVNLDVLQHYIKTGKGSNLPEDLIMYMELLDMVRALYSKYETKGFILNTLMSEQYGLSRYIATQIYIDALNFFYSDNQIKQKAWENVYAEHLDKLAYYALETDDLETARKCFLDAAKMRGVGGDERANVPKEMEQKPVIIYTINPKQVGIPTASRLELAKFIDEIPDITERERARLNRESGVSEATLFEEILNEDKKNPGN